MFLDLITKCNHPLNFRNLGPVIEAERSYDCYCQLYNFFMTLPDEYRHNSITKHIYEDVQHTKTIFPKWLNSAPLKNPLSNRSLFIIVYSFFYDRVLVHTQ